MFYDGPKVSGEMECRPNYEEAAARLKKTIDADRDFLKTFPVFCEQGSFHYLNNKDQVPFFALFGAMVLRLPKLEDEYAGLLKKIEGDGKR